MYLSDWGAPLGNAYAYVAKMLPQLKWCTLNDADINQISFGTKKSSFKCDYRGFGGVGGSQCCRFFGGPQSNTYFFKNKKKYGLCTLSPPNSTYFRIL